MMITILILAVILLSGCAGGDHAYLPQDGDIIFHTSTSAQSQAVQAATGSRYSHMGLVFVNDGNPVVLEAVQPVKATPLADWIARGVDGRFTVRRLANRDEARLAAAAPGMSRTFLGKPYDIHFEWTDDSIYCSELVWKIYDRELGIKLAPLAEFRTFDLTNPIVQTIIQTRWGDNPPLDMQVITPAAILNSPLLEEVPQ